MDFLALRTELAARGFDYLDSQRLGVFVNAARGQLDNRALWPYRFKVATGVAPLNISDLGTIKAVRNTVLNYEVQPTSYEQALDDFGDLSITGPPAMFWVDLSNNAAVPQLLTYPTNTNPLSVRYYRRLPDLAADGDVPGAPADYHMLIVDMAVQRAYMDSDNYAEAQQLQGSIDMQVAVMTNDLLGGQQVAGPQDHQALTGYSVDG